MAIWQETIGPGEKDFVIQVRLGSKDGKPFAQGKYIASGVPGSTIIANWLCGFGPLSS
jgi:hypothetical protein